MKIGFDLLLWTTHATAEHQPILEALKETGYDGVEIPVFEGDPEEYRRLGALLDELALERTAITVIPSVEQNPLSESADVRAAGRRYLEWCVDCAEALGSRFLCGPLHSTLGHFSGAGPTSEERARAVDFHRAVGDYAGDKGVSVVLEALNRFECYFLNTMEDLADYLDEVGHPAITGMYDTFHANIEEKDPIGCIGDTIRHIAHVHISENDRGVPGRGHVDFPATFRALKWAGYDGWLTIEAFGRALPELAAATRVWRDLSDSPAAVYRDGFQLIRDGWDAA
jgi:D-psicose/D-tagatose/L-ribulose 3-epimerase